MIWVCVGAFRKISKRNLIQTVPKGQRYNRFKLCNWSLEIFQQCFLAKLWQEPSLSQAFDVRGLPDPSIQIWHWIKSWTVAERMQLLNFSSHNSISKWKNKTDDRSNLEIWKADFTNGFSVIVWVRILYKKYAKMLILGHSVYCTKNETCFQFSTADQTEVEIKLFIVHLTKTSPVIPVAKSVFLYVQVGTIVFVNGKHKPI